MSTQFTRSLFTRSPQRSLKSYLLLLSTLTASSVLISNGALAETQASQSSTSPTSTADLIKAVSNDPMTMTPAKEQPSLTGESAVIQQINQQTSRELTNKLAESKLLVQSIKLLKVVALHRFHS